MVGHSGNGNGGQFPRLVLTLEVRGSTPAYLSPIRRWVARAVAGLSERHTADVLLVADELARDAYLHRGGLEVIRIIRRRHPCSVRIEVECAGRRPAASDPSRAADDQPDLVVVGRTARAWGAGARTAWAEISCEDPPASPR